MPDQKTMSRSRLHDFVRAVAMLPVIAAAGCSNVEDPYPQPLPPNLEIAAEPAAGDVVDAAGTVALALRFDQPMERESLRHVQRVSFLVPLAVRDFDGVWTDSDHRVRFDLTSFPTQSGAAYEVRFIGLRKKDGELYNGGPFEMHFRTAGTPDLLPVRPHPRVATRVYCRTTAGGACTSVVLHSENAGGDSVRVHSTCEDCTESRDDWYRRVDNRIQWLGWDVLDADEGLVQSVRWPSPPVLFADGTRTGSAFTAARQVSASGVELQRWRATNRGTGSPVYDFPTGDGSVEVVYNEATILELDYALLAPGGVPEAIRERWWLLPGVGIVRRETRVARDGVTVRSDADLFTPSVLNLGGFGKADADQRPRGAR